MTDWENIGNVRQYNHCSDTPRAFCFGELSVGKCIQDIA